jgi:hypothetical protein
MTLNMWRRLCLILSCSRLPRRINTLSVTRGLDPRVHSVDHTG